MKKPCLYFDIVFYCIVTIIKICHIIQLFYFTFAIFPILYKSLNYGSLLVFIFFGQLFLNHS